MGKLRDFDAENDEDIAYLKWKYWFRVGGIYYTEAACHIMLHSQSWEFIGIIIIFFKSSLFYVRTDCPHWTLSYLK